MNKEGKYKPVPRSEKPEKTEGRKTPDIIEKIRKDADDRYFKNEIDEEARDAVFGILDGIQSAASKEEKLKIIDNAYFGAIIDEETKDILLEREEGVVAETPQ